MSTKWEDRVEEIKKAETDEELRDAVCPFFKFGGSPECLTCMQRPVDFEECRDFFLERIYANPMDMWSTEFDNVIVKRRDDKVSLSNASGIGVSCNHCYMSSKCTMYKKDYECAISWESDRPTNPNEFYDYMINIQYERINRAHVYEKVDGGVPDPNLSKEMDRLNDLIQSKQNLTRTKFSMHINAEGGMDEGVPRKGILSEIFGSRAIPEKAETLVDTTYEDVTVESVRVPRKRTDAK